MLCRVDYVYIYAYAYLCICVPYVMGNLKTLGPSIKYVTLFLSNFNSLPCHTLSHIQGLPKVRHTSRTPPPIFSRPSTKTRTKYPCTNFLSIVHAGFCPGVCQRVFCLEGFVQGGFCPFTLCQNTSVTTEN